MLKSTGTRLFASFLGYIALIILVLTLNPFYFVMPGEVSIKFESSIGNLYNNILLFLPLGFLYRMTTGRRGAMVMGFCLSLGIETLQLFIPARTTSIVDVLANTLGAGLGTLVYDLIAPRIQLTPGVVNRSHLQMPLMGLVYLLVPLLWIDTLALHEAPYHWLLTPLLGLCGAILFSHLFRHWWEVLNLKVILYAAVSAGVWFLVGIGPRLTRSITLIIIALGVMLLTAVLTGIPRRSNERRFERKTISHLLPVFVIYLFLLALFFPFQPFGTWHFFFGFTDRLTETSLFALYSRVEYLAAFTVLGYLIAEWQGRLELPLLQALPRLLLVAAGTALLLELFIGFQVERGASIVRLLLVLACAILGGSIYHLSRAHIRFLLGR
jgi:glycopeptide antibiotics resistance protein